MRSPPQARVRAHTQWSIMHWSQYRTVTRMLFCHAVSGRSCGHLHDVGCKMHSGNNGVHEFLLEMPSRFLIFTRNLPVQ